MLECIKSTCQSIKEAYNKPELYGTALTGLVKKCKDFTTSKTLTSWTQASDEGNVKTTVTPKWCGFLQTVTRIETTQETVMEEVEVDVDGVKTKKQQAKQETVQDPNDKSNQITQDVTTEKQTTTTKTQCRVLQAVEILFRRVVGSVATVLATIPATVGLGIKTIHLIAQGISEGASRASNCVAKCCKKAETVA